jgi:hypothetical protein
MEGRWTDEANAGLAGIPRLLVGIQKQAATEEELRKRNEDLFPARIYQGTLKIMAIKYVECTLDSIESLDNLVHEVGQALMASPLLIG